MTQTTYQNTESKDMTVLELAGLMSKYASHTEEQLRSLRTEMHDRFDRIENIILPAHERRIEKLEDESRHVRTYLKLA